MKRIRIMGLCLVAVFAFTAMAAATASAKEPAYFGCVKKVGGAFEKGCKGNVKGKGGFELVQGNGEKHKVFKGKGGKAKLTTPGLSSVVECASFKDEGHIGAGGETQEKVISKFGKCTTAKKNCTSALPAKKGEIITNSLQGALGYISKSPLKVGSVLSAEGGGALAEFTCEGLVIKTTGAVIGELTEGINVLSKKSTSTYAVDGEFKQVPTKFEGGPKEVLVTEILGEGAFESGQQAVAVNAGEELEIKA